MSDKITLVTGANKSIGFETAGQLGKQNIRILVGARDTRTNRRRKNFRRKTSRLRLSSLT